MSIYNDPYRPVLGAKHPWALGQPVSECWQEIWHILRPLIDTPFHGGPSTWNDDMSREINRYGFVEETHVTIAYSPVPGDTASNGIGGVLATVHEITEKVIGERRLAVLHDLDAQAAEPKSAEEACRIILDIHVEEELLWPIDAVMCTGVCRSSATCTSVSVRLCRPVRGLTRRKKRYWYPFDRIWPISSPECSSPV